MSMEISEFSMSRLHNEEHFQFHSSVAELITVSNPAALKIEAQATLYQAELAKELEAINVIRKSAISDDLVEADNVRDKIFRGMCNQVKSAVLHFNADVQEAAKRAQIVLDTYGNVAVKNYDAETGAIISLVNDFKTTYAADAAKAGITEWVEELALSNKAYDDLKNNRYTDDATKTIVRMKQQRNAVDQAYRVLQARINALIIVEGAASYSAFVAELNKRIEGFENTLAIRKGKARKTTGTAQ